MSHKHAVPIGECDPDGCRFAVTRKHVNPWQHRFCNKPVIPGTSWCDEHASTVGLTEADKQKARDRNEQLKAESDARAKRGMLDFALHYTIKAKGATV